MPLAIAIAPAVRSRAAISPRQNRVWTSNADSALKVAAAVGIVIAGAALVEAALIPGLVLGGAVVFAPRQLSRFAAPLLRRRPSPAPMRPRPRAARQDVAAPSATPRTWVTQAVVKTITFRVVVTSIDFSVNYLVVGEVATAATLSGIGLFIGPLFYFVHEYGWNRYGPKFELSDDLWATRMEVAVPPALRVGPLAGRKSLSVSRALAKTITFRAIASAMDFTGTYLIVRDVATAATLSASGLVLGPFVYLGHELAWDTFGRKTVESGETAPA